MELYETQITDVHGKKYKIEVIDTAGSLYEVLEKWVYPDTSVFILCYSVFDRDTFDFLKTFFATSIRQNLDEYVPLILVGNKIELAPVKSDCFVTPEGAEVLAFEIGAAGSIQCSGFVQSETNIGNVDKAFDLAMKAALEIEKRA